jgi:hypothetical protein
MIEKKFIYNSGQNDIPRGTYFDAMDAAGIDGYMYVVQPLINKHGIPTGNNPWSRSWGWNDKFFNLVKGKLNYLKPRGGYLTLFTASAPINRRKTREHIFHVYNGGWLTGDNLVRQYYSDLLARAKHRELLTELHRRLPAHKYPNLLIALCWENHSAFYNLGLTWAVEMATHWQNMDTRPVGTGCIKWKQINDISTRTPRRIFGLVEAHNPFSWKRKQGWVSWRQIKKYNWYWFGYWPWETWYYSQKNPALKKALLQPGCEKRNAWQTIRCTAKLLLKGIPFSLPFRQVMRPDATKLKEWGFAPGECKYNFQLYRNFVYGYLHSIENILKDPDSLSRPDVRAVFKYKTKQYMRSLR